MKRFFILGVLIALMMTACGGTETPYLPTLSPATVVPTESAPVPEPTDPPVPTEIPSATPVVSATAFPDPNAYTWAEVISGLERPVDIQSPRDGSGRLFIVEKIGRIRILQDNQLLADPFLNISDRVGARGNEQGLLGLAFHPNFSENGYFFVNYTDKSGNTHIARFTARTPGFADPATEKDIFYVAQPFGNHNAGALAFGPDGYLYVPLGDGGSAGDPQNNGQNLNTALGSILRLDVDNGDPYTIPATNPFGNEIWAYGLRNPWRISFDITGDLYIGDVGQNQWEEIDLIPAGSPGGQNFGWSIMEASYPYHEDSSEGMTPPIAEYRHGPGCSVTGGYVYRGIMAEWNGVYFFGDYCSGQVWGLLRSDEGWQAEVLFDTGMNITTFGLDEAGELYLASDSGQILRLIPH
ncbi:MAG: PQQ-dependent sugar dehydrogenase [Anaerolineales bacterium]